MAQDPQHRFEESDGTLRGAFYIDGNDSLSVQVNGTDSLTIDTNNDVSIDNGSLSIPTGQSIEDGGGQKRLDLDSGFTGIFNQNGDGGILIDSSNIRIRPNSNINFKIEDEEGAFDAVQYTTSASAPGTLELTNADLDANNNDITNVNSVSTEQTQTKTIDSGTVHYCAEYDGASPDDRLDNALAAADRGHHIYLEIGDYTTDRTGQDAITLQTASFIGHGPGGAGTLIDANWEFNESLMGIEKVRIDGGNTLSLNGVACYAKNSEANGTIRAEDDRCLIWGIGNIGTVEFASGTSDGEAGVLSGDLTATDGGSNNIL